MGATFLKKYFKYFFKKIVTEKCKAWISSRSYDSVKYIVICKCHVSLQGVTIKTDRRLTAEEDGKTGKERCSQEVWENLPLHCTF